MRAYMLLLLAIFGLLQVLPQAQADAESESLYEEEPDTDSEQEGDTDYLEPELEHDTKPEGERNMPQATREDQQPWSSAHRRRSSKEFWDYTPFLLCLQRKQAQVREAQQKARHKGLPELKTQASSWVEHMKSVEAEVAKTRCQPREVCVQVSAEHPASTNTFYIPKCISVHRCRGCCSGERRSCISTSQDSISKTLIELTIPPSREPRPVSIPFVNHTGCECSSSLNPRRSINRRASKDLHPTNAEMVRASLWPTSRIYRRCSKAQVSCGSGLSWDPIRCGCVEDQEMLQIRGNDQAVAVCGPLSVFSWDSCSCVCKLDHDRSKCGPQRMFSEDSCSCVCKNRLDGLSCGSHQVFSEDSCRCVCKNGLDELSCSPHKVFSGDSCRCVCTNGLDELSCGTHRVLSEDSCSCVCTNGLDELSCGTHRVLSEDSCSCVCKNSLDELSCGPHRVFSEDSCRCVCMNGLNSSSCGSHQVFNKDSCRCVCMSGIDSLICGPHKILEDSTCACVCPKPTLRNSCQPDWAWDKEKCSCTCRKICPKHTSLNEATCQCECQDQGSGCTHRGMMYDPRSYATGYLAQGGGHGVRATITIVTLFAIAYRTT